MGGVSSELVAHTAHVGFHPPRRHSTPALLPPVPDCSRGLRRPSRERREPLAFRHLRAASSTPADPYPLLEPGDIDVNQTTHTLYVADTGNSRVEKLTTPATSS